jgi:hypothetical protein
MTLRLHTTYSMLGRNGRTPPAAPQPPQPQPNADVDYNSDDSIDPWFEEWDEAYIADAEAEATQWGEPPQVPADPEQAAILTSLNAQRFQCLEEEHL